MASVYLAPVKGVGVDAATVEVATELLRQAVLEQKLNLAKAAQGSESQWQLTLVAVGESYRVTLERSHSSEAPRIRSMRAQSEDDLDVVVTRLVRAVERNEKVADTADVDNVTTQEGRAANRKRAQRGLRVGLGPMALANLNEDEVAGLFHLGLAFAVEDIQLKLFLERAYPFGEGRNSSLIMLGMGGSYYFSNASHTAFVGASLGFGWATRDLELNNEPSAFESENLEEVSGFGLGLELGYAFLRTSNIGVDVSLLYQAVFASTTEGTPQAYGLRVAFTF